jgi:hypothetical protein
MVADVNFHDLQSNNPHAHVMLTMRDLIVTDGRVEFGNKNRDWNRKELLIQQRQNWEILANKYLAKAGYNNVRIDCRSLEEQGIERIPQIHLGANVNAMRLKGISTDRGDHYDEIEKANQQIRADLERVDRESKERESATAVNRPNFERHRRNLSNIGRDDGRSISRQGEIGNQPGADRQTDLETRTNGSRSSQQKKVSKDTRQPIGASSDHSENRPDPDLQSARSTDATSSSNTNFSSTKARLVELSNRAKAGRPGAAASEQRDDNARNDVYHPDRTGDADRIRSKRDQGQYASGNPADEQPDPRVDRQVSPGASRATEGGKETEAETQKAQTLADLNKSPEVIVKVKIDKPEKKRSSGMSLGM